MKYRYFDINGNEVTHRDLEDKGAWCQDGLQKEHVFIDLFGERFNIEINPEKETNQYAPDLWNHYRKRLSDLKVQNTPFFSARRYGRNPQHTVTFNCIDAERYAQYYPNIDIFFWVDWIPVHYVDGYGNETRVNPMTGIWHARLPKLLSHIKESPIHKYQRRVNDQKGNAKDSYLLDLTSPVFNKLA